MASAVREPLQGNNALRSWETSGSCIHQSEIGRRVLLERFGLETTILVGDFMRPMADDLHHTYTDADGKICLETGACHAWLYCRSTGEYIDFAAWEAPVRMERHGAHWTGPRPDYLWDRPAVLRAQGHLDTIHRPFSVRVAEELRRGRDAEFFRLYMKHVLAVLDAGLRDLRSAA